jgi:predicted enzyme related to lactoylglutathione lyase
MAVNPIVHIELSAKNGEAAGKFYRDLFGWTVKPFEGSDYVTFEAKPGPGGGFNVIDKDHKAGEIIPYLQVDDIEAMLAKITAHGGRTVKGKTEIPGEGHFGLFEDPSGNRVGLFSG